MGRGWFNVTGTVQGEQCSRLELASGILTSTPRIQAKLYSSYTVLYFFLGERFLDEPISSTSLVHTSIIFY